MHLTNLLHFSKVNNELTQKTDRLIEEKSENKRSKVASKNNDEITKLKQEHAKVTKRSQDVMECKENICQVKTDRRVVKKSMMITCKKIENSIKQLAIGFKDEIEALQNENEIKTNAINNMENKSQDQKENHNEEMIKLKSEIEKT